MRQARHRAVVSPVCRWMAAFEPLVGTVPRVDQSEPGAEPSRLTGTGRAGTHHHGDEQKRGRPWDETRKERFNARG